MTITEQLDAKYNNGSFAVVVTHYKVFPVYRRDMIRESSDGRGVEIRQGKRWVFAYPYQVKFAHSA